MAERPEEPRVRKGLRTGSLLRMSTIAPDAALTLDAEGKVVSANPNAEKLFGKPAEQLVGEHISKLIPPHWNEHFDASKMLQDIEANATPGNAYEHPVQTTVAAMGPKGKPTETYFRIFGYKPMGEKKPLIFAHLTHTEPILEKSRVLEQLIQTNAAINEHQDLKLILPKVATQLGTSMRAAALVATVATEEDRATHPDVQPGNELILRAAHGFDPADLPAVSRIAFNQGLMGVAAAHRVFKRETDLQAYPTSVAPQLDRKYNLRDSIAIPLLANGTRPGDQPFLVGVIGLFKHGALAGEEFKPHEVKILRHLADSAATKIYEAQLSKKLQHLADHDSLTGAYNRGKLFRSLGEYVQPRRQGANGTPTHSLPAGSRFGMLYLDVDNLKPVNDRFGHKAGNEALRAVVDALRHAVREAGVEDRAVIARLGGDEFGALIRDSDEQTNANVHALFQERLARAVSANPQFKRAGLGASTAHVTFATEGRSHENVVSLDEMARNFKGWKHVDDEHYLDSILNAPERRAMAQKAASKRESGYIDKKALRGFAEHFSRNPNMSEKRFMTLLAPYINLKHYRIAKQAFRERPPGRGKPGRG